MPDDGTFDDERHEPSVWTVSSFFSPGVCAVTAFTLAFVALLGQNIVTTGIGVLLGPNVGPSGQSGFYFAWGLAVAVQVGVALLLARRTLGAAGRWEAVLGRAAVLVSAIALVAAVLAVIGAVIHEGSPGF